jgi:hypothetical protein
MNIIFEIANTVFPANVVHKLHDRIKQKLTINNKNKHLEEKEERKKKWINFNYHNRVIRKITNLFHNANLKVAFETPNTIFKMLQEETRTE